MIFSIRSELQGVKNGSSREGRGEFKQPHAPEKKECSKETPKEEGGGREGGNTEAKCPTRVDRPPPPPPPKLPTRGES